MKKNKWTIYLSLLLGLVIMGTLVAFIAIGSDEEVLAYLIFESILGIPIVIIAYIVSNNKDRQKTKIKK